MGNYKTLTTVNNVDYTFNVIGFRDAVDSYIESHQIKKCILWSLMEDKLGVSDNAVKQWYYENNGPSSLDLVKGMGEILSVDYHDLLTERQRHVEGVVNQVIETNLNSSEKEHLEQLYEAIMKFSDMMIETNGGEIIPGDNETKDPDAIHDYYAFYFGYMHSTLDNIALSLKKSTWQKMHILIMELESDFYSGDIIPRRWRRINPLYRHAKMLRGFGCDEFSDEEEDEHREAVDKIIEEFFEGAEMDVRYSLQVENMPFSVPLATDIEDPEEARKKLQEMVDSITDHGSVPYTVVEAPVLQHIQITNVAAYKREFTRLITDIFREDFPEYFPGE